MPIVAKHRAVLQQNHPDALQSAHSGKPSDIYLVLGPEAYLPPLSSPLSADLDPEDIDAHQPDHGNDQDLANLPFEQLEQPPTRPRPLTTLGLTTGEALRLATELLADVIAIRMIHADNQEEEDATRLEFAQALEGAVARRKVHPSLYFPGEFPETQLSVRVLGVTVMLERCAAMVEPAVLRSELLGQLDDLLRPQPALASDLAAARLLYAAQLSLNWVSRHGSLHECVYAWLPDMVPQHDLLDLLEPPTFSSLGSTFRRAAHAYQEDAEAPGNSALVYLALNALLLCALTCDEVLTWPADRVLTGPLAGKAAPGFSGAASL